MEDDVDDDDDDVGDNDDDDEDDNDDDVEVEDDGTDSFFCYDGVKEKGNAKTRKHTRVSAIGRKMVKNKNQFGLSTELTATEMGKKIRYPKMNIYIRR